MEDLAIKVNTLEEKMKVANNRISDLEDTTKRIESLTISVEKLAMSVEVMAKEQVEYRSKQNELANRLLEVEQYPFREKSGKYEKYVGQIISLVVGAVISYLLFSLIGI